MSRQTSLFTSRSSTWMLGGCALTLVSSIILFPDKAFQASMQGLTIWWELVFPALLPFLILTEIMIGLGVMHFIGSMLNPLFRFLFRLPGTAGWVMALGLTAGMPAGAAAVGSLRRDGLISRMQAERLLAASHLMNPVFLISIAGAGLLHSPKAGLALAVIHYTSALLMMMIQRLQTARMEKQLPGEAMLFLPLPPSEAMHRAKRNDGRTFGKLLGDAVTTSVQKLFMIGGYMMMFSVLLQMAAAMTSLPLPYGEIENNDRLPLVAAAVAALLEPYMGTFALTLFKSSWTTLPFALISLAIAWGGLSTHAQTISLTAGTDLRYSRFVSARILHSGIAFLLTLLLWEPLMLWLSGSRGLALAAWSSTNQVYSGEQHTLWPLISPMMLQFGAILLMLLIISVFTAFAFQKRRTKE